MLEGELASFPGSQFFFVFFPVFFCFLLNILQRESLRMRSRGTVTYITYCKVKNIDRIPSTDMRVGMAWQKVVLQSLQKHIFW